MGLAGLDDAAVALVDFHHAAVRLGEHAGPFQDVVRLRLTGMGVHADTGPRRQYNTRIKTRCAEEFFFGGDAIVVSGPVAALCMFLFNEDGFADHSDSSLFIRQFIRG